jgi:hypothetical protein
MDNVGILPFLLRVLDSHCPGFFIKVCTACPDVSPCIDQMIFDLMIGKDF